MSKNRTPLEKAAGKLISAIQKEWGYEAGENTAAISEDVMGKAHDLLQAADVDEIYRLLGSLSVSEYLGEIWVRRHPSVQSAITNFEKEL